MRRERGRRHPLLDVERLADEEERAERRAPRGERKLDGLALGSGVTARDDATVVGAEAGARRAGGLERRLHDHAQQLLHVVGGGERLADRFV